MSRSVFITGATGFIGAYITQQLVEKGYRVKALRRSNSKIPFFIPSSVWQKVEWVEGDVLDVIALDEAMNDVDLVIHSAAVISFDTGAKDNMNQVNIEGTANVVNIALEKNIQKLLHVSSVAALGRTQSGDHVTEEKKWQESKINTQYAISKHKAEMEVWRAIGEGLNAVIINPSTVLGYGDWNTSSCRIFKTVYDEFPWYTSGINGFVAVTDVARAAIALLESDITEQRFIVNGDNWTFQQLFNTIADGFHKKRPSKHATPFMGQVAWRMEKLKSFFTGKAPLLTKESARVAQSKTYFENSKILKSLPGFSFTPLEDIIKIACEQYLAQ